MNITWTVLSRLAIIAFVVLVCVIAQRRSVHAQTDSWIETAVLQNSVAIFKNKRSAACIAITMTVGGGIVTVLPKEACE